MRVVFWLHFYMDVLRAMVRLTMVEEGDNGGRWWLELGGMDEMGDGECWIVE